MSDQNIAGKRKHSVSFATDVATAAQSIGYAIGVLTGLADMTELDERQTNCVDEAIDGLRQIDLCKLSGLEDANGEA